MAFELKFNANDVKRIVGKLTKIGDEITKPDGLIFQYRWLLLDEYKNAVAAAMGSVSATSGGRANFGTLQIGTPVSAYWHALSPYTVAKKVYQGSNNALSIWADTGETKDAVKIYGSVGDTTVFSGIQGGEAYRKALNTEFGGVSDGSGNAKTGSTFEWPSRPLFTVVNEAFIQNRAGILEAMHQRLVTITKNAGWGS